MCVCVFKAEKVQRKKDINEHDLNILFVVRGYTKKKISIFLFFIDSLTLSIYVFIHTHIYTYLFYLHLTFLLLLIRCFKERNLIS